MMFSDAFAKVYGEIYAKLHWLRMLNPPFTLSSLVTLLKKEGLDYGMLYQL